MSQDTTSTISKAMEPEEAEVEGHRWLMATAEVTEEPEPEVEGHRTFISKRYRSCSLPEPLSRVC